MPCPTNGVEHGIRATSGGVADTLGQVLAVKVVTDRQGDALYFSRSLIPYPRHPEFCTWREHVGLYAFRRDLLLEFVAWPPTPLEQTESLEQVRIHEYGYPIRVVETELGSGAPCIDTPEDLARTREYLRSHTPSHFG